MNDLLQIFIQLGVNSTLLIQFVTVVIVFVFLSKFFFTPYLKLFELRHKRLIEDRENANKMIEEANKKFETYNKSLSSARREAQLSLEKAISEAKAQEAALLGAAREEAKKIQLTAAASLEQERTKVQAVLAADVDAFAKEAIEKILARKG